MNFFLGVDAGGTKTRAVIIDQESKLIAEAFGGAANYHNTGLTEATQHVLQTVESAISKSLLAEKDITWMTIGIAGCDTHKDRERLLGAFKTTNNELAERLTLQNDTVIGLYSGILPPGLVVICGTGSNVYGKNEHGEEASAGNWGHFLGDHGSGYVLAKRLFETVIRFYDGIEKETVLTKRLEGRLQVGSSAGLMDWYYETAPTVRQISDFAPIVITAAEEGDEVAKELLDQTVAELGRALVAVVKRLKMEEAANRIVIVGGLFESKYFRALFEGHVTALLKRVRVVKPLVSAAVGAAIMAKHEWERLKK